MAPLKTLTTHYQILGVDPKADPETLRKAYRKLARRHHPDVSSDPRAHENMARINEAFNILIDEDRRVEYDAALAGGNLSRPEPTTKKTTPPKPVVVKLLHRLAGHHTPIYAMTYDPDNGRLISSGFDNELIWWDEANQAVLRRLKIEAGVVSTLRAMPGDKLVAAGSSETTITYWRLSKGTVENWKSANEEWVSSLAISPSGDHVATGSLHRFVSSWSTSNGQSIFQRHEHTDGVTAVAWSDDGEIIASGSADSLVKLFHGKNGALLQTIHGVRSTVTAMSFSPDRKYLAVASVDLTVRVFLVTDGSLVKIMRGHTKPVEAMAFHPNGWLFATASRDGSVGLWNAANGIGNLRIECSTRPISAVAFSANGKRLAAAGQDKIVRVWEVKARPHVAADDAVHAEAKSA